MNILGIHDGHTATACLIQNGKVIFNISEERFTKIKGQGGFPTLAVQYILREANLTPKDIDAVGLVGLAKPLTSIKEYNSGRQLIFPYLLKAFPLDPRNLIKSYIRFAGKKRLKDEALIKNFENIGIDLSKVNVFEHHQTHAATAYYMSGFYQKNEDTLVITLDGSGDGLSGTVSVVKNGKWERLKEISSIDSLGIVYGRATQYLGMKPWEHEYKLMGMAPYCNEEYAQRAHKIFSKYLTLSEDGLGFTNPTRNWGNSLLEAMRRDLKTIRFDAVSAGVQLLHENLATQFVINWIKKTGISNVAVAGGSFMNIKANKLLIESAECKNLFVMPSGGDESCALGACLLIHNEKSDTKNEPLLHLYWGPDNKEEQILETLKKYADKIDFEKSADIELKSAQLLAEHKILGRVSGRMEWGARALGNRSIVANPSRTENLRDLNIAIKMRDFWMPFAPSILWESRKDYAVYPKDKEVDAYLMTIGFDSTELAKDHLRAALHPYDQTMRPQYVKADYNPAYHKMLNHFKDITGIGGVLNTSFNLHGMPIVNDTEDAIYTLLHSDLDYVTVNDYLIWKKK
ncbi:MAG: hypothetical protein MH137_01810 [Flavobacteriales bacterium]|nr:hypothetical protein [Flavobacteriales bacterium]